MVECAFIQYAIRGKTVPELTEIHSACAVSFCGVCLLVIRTFRIGDIFFAQRLLRQAARLNPALSLTCPRPSLWRALLPTNPLDDAKTYTFLLEQQDNSVARAGLLQAQKRAGRPEADITLLAPRLDARYGHPAIWQKLLAHFSQIAVQAGVRRVYIAAPDEPTIVQTLNNIGFRVYSRQTVWRLIGGLSEHVPKVDYGQVRLQCVGDEWGLIRLYSQSTPKAVQLAEGAHSDKQIRLPILDSRVTHADKSYILYEKDRITGCIQVTLGSLGAWLTLWVDTRQPAPQRIHQLIQQGVAAICEHDCNLPIYIGVDEYQGGIAPLLVEYGFAPFTDVVKAVKQTVQPVYEGGRIRMPVLETLPRVASAPYHRHSTHVLREHER